MHIWMDCIYQPLFSFPKKLERVTLCARTNLRLKDRTYKFISPSGPASLLNEVGAYLSQQGSSWLLAIGSS